MHNPTRSSPYGIPKASRTPPSMTTRAAALAAVLAAVLTAPFSPAPGLAHAAPEDPPAQPPAPLIPLQTFFKGKVRSLKDRRIEIVYDFENAAQLEDFDASCPFRAIRTVKYAQKNGRVHIEGTGSMRHKAVFEDDVSMESVMSPRKPRDFGYAVSEHHPSEMFTLYCCYDRYFGLGDGVHIPQNMVIRFIERGAEVQGEGMQDWRYCGSRGQKPEIRIGQPYKVGMGRTGMESRMSIGDDFKSEGKEAGRVLRGLRLSLYAYDSSVEVDDLVVRGVLDKEFIEKNRLDLAGFVPASETTAPATGAPPPMDEALAARVRAQIEGYPMDTKPPAMAAILRDAKLPAVLRDEGAAKVKAVASKKIVPFLTDGLYSDDADSRRIAIDLVKTLVGRDFGYRASAPEESRKKAIQAFNDFLQKKPEEFR
jgi:hypothetical protein